MSILSCPRPPSPIRPAYPLAYRREQPFARTADDARLNARLRDVEREGDPMAEMLAKRKVGRRCGGHWWPVVWVGRGSGGLAGGVYTRESVDFLCDNGGLLAVRPFTCDANVSCRRCRTLARPAVARAVRRRAAPRWTAMLFSGGSRG